MGLIKDLFYQGEYLQVLEKTYEGPRQPESDAFVYIVGSLTFLGRLQEAEAFYLASQGRVTPLQKSYVYFFLALALTRRSKYQRAKKYLILNRTLLKNQSAVDFEMKFLVEQGISFFLHFLGKFDKSLQWSEKSLGSAIATHDFWMKALGHDLLANNLIQTGSVHEGLRHFSEALKYAKKLKNTALSTAIEISTINFSCEYGIELKSSYEKLKAQYNAVKNKDDFSAANLGLEYARQLTLRGEWKMAGEKLNEISSLIFQNQNRRQEARFNLRWGELHFLKNESSACLLAVRSGSRCLELVDYTYEMQFLGLEKKVYEKLLLQSPPEVLGRRLQELSLKYNNIKNNNMMSREKSFKKVKSQNSDDEIHNLIEKSEQNPKLARTCILQTGYFSWLYRFFDLKRGEKYILLNLEPKSITYIGPDGIFHEPGELSTLNYKILNKLSEGYTSKENLVQSVWGYGYDPLRHDSLIYSTFSSLRKIFRHDPRLIETSELGYALNAKVVNLLETSRSRDVAEKPEMILLKSDMKNLLDLNLNSRQIQIMQYLEAHPFISVKIVVKLFLTSEITANRDLRTLFEKKLVLRVGQGRATEYTKV